MVRRWHQRGRSWLKATWAWLSYGLGSAWSSFQRRYRRIFGWIAIHLRFWFYPILVVGTLSFLAWDWVDDKDLDEAENQIFDLVIKWRPNFVEPTPSRRVVVVEIDDCSIGHVGAWPWSRQIHAELLESLNDAGAVVVGYDVLFIDDHDPEGDKSLNSIAEKGNGRYIFGSARLHQNLDDKTAAIPVSEVSGAFRLGQGVSDPMVAMQLPYGKAMKSNSALLNVGRDADGMLRDVPLSETVKDHWALPSLALALAARYESESLESYPDSVRVNWRKCTSLPTISAVRLFKGGETLCPPAPTKNEHFKNQNFSCGDPDETPLTLDALKGRVVLVGYTATGLSDAKPTPVGLMPGVVVHAEATEALLANSAVWTWKADPRFKYWLAACLVIGIGGVFYCGVPVWDIDPLFITINILLVSAAIIGLVAFKLFFDIFAALAFVALFFGLCRIYASTQRGRAIGNDDYRVQFDPQHDHWLALVRLRFVPDPGLEGRAHARQVHEYRDRLHRFLYRGIEAVALEGIVEYKSWLWEAMADVTVLMWGGPDPATVGATAQRELLALRAHLARHDDLLPDRGSVWIACLMSAAAAEDEPIARTRSRVSRLLGRLLSSTDEHPLEKFEGFVDRHADSGIRKGAESAARNST